MSSSGSSRQSSPGSGLSLTAASPHRLRRRSELAAQRLRGSQAGQIWSRLSALDFINRAMLLAAILLLCLFPFLIVVSALAGRAAVDGLARRLGLNNEAAQDLAHLFTSSSSTSSAVTAGGCVILILYGLAAAYAIGELYERIFGLRSRGIRDMPRRFAWLWMLVAAGAFSGWAGPALRSWGGQALVIAVGAVAFTLFWWFTMWFLLSGRIRPRELMPGAIATGIFWLGMEVVFGLVFSGIVISNYETYGPIGVVFSLLTWLISVGVVIILGAVVGLAWHERGVPAASFGRAAGSEAAPQAGKVDPAVMAEDHQSPATGCGRASP